MRDLASIFSWFLIIFGWFFVSRNIDGRERRKETRALLSEIRILVLQIEDKAHEYHASVAFNSEKNAMMIKRDLKRLGGIISALKGLNAKFNLSNELHEFRQIITGRDFESKERKERLYNDAIFVEISEAAVKLTSAMEAMYARSYS